MTAPKTAPAPRTRKTPAKAPAKTVGEAATTALVVEAVEAAGGRTVTVAGLEWTPADMELMPIGYELAVELAEKQAAEAVVTGS